MSITELVTLIRMLLIALFSFIFVIKIILFYKYEKEWNSITFFHFTTIQLKMTVSKELRKWRKYQNLLTKILLVFILLLAAISAFNLLIEG